MHALPLLLVATFTTAAPARTGAARPPENLLAGPARCVLRYLDAVRLGGTRVAGLRAGRAPTADEREYATAKRLTAPRTLEEIARRAARGEDHPLAAWREAARGRVLESFQLLAARRAPRGAAVVTVKERYWVSDPDATLVRSVSEYLVARVEGEWKVIDRRPGGAFEDAEVAGSYAGFFDEPPSTARSLLRRSESAEAEARRARDERAAEAYP
jgi:hypothetical protein